MHPRNMWIAWKDMVLSMSERAIRMIMLFAEIFIKTLKYEEVYLDEYITFNDALANVDRSIEEEKFDMQA